MINRIKKSQGFLNKENNKIKINYNKTTSVLLNKIQLDFLLDNKNYLKGKLLDAGCGEKPYSLIYDEYVVESIGCDVETCKHNQKFVDVFASLDSLPFNDEEFDTILCTNVMEHVFESKKAFGELTRVLKSGGNLILSIPFLYPAHEIPYDFYRYTNFGIKKQLENRGYLIQENFAWGGIGLLICVYINLFFCKLVKIHVFSKCCCYIQEIFYQVYRTFCFKHLDVTDDNLLSKISCGYFVIATKK